MNRMQALQFLQRMNEWKEEQRLKREQRAANRRAHAERSAAIRAERIKHQIASVDKGGNRAKRVVKLEQTDKPVRKFYKKHHHYTPMNLTELLVWEFMCLKPETADLNNRPLLTLRGPVDRDLDFSRAEAYVNAYEHAYL